MYIDKLVIKNIRCFEEETLQLSKNINLLVGENNSGKSTIIKSIYKLQEEISIKTSDIRKYSISGIITYEFLGMEAWDCNLFLVTHEDSFESDKITATITIKTNEGQANRKFTNDSPKYENLFMPFTESELGNSKEQKPMNIFPYKEDMGCFIYPFFSKRKHESYLSQVSYEETNAVRGDLRNLTAKLSKISNPSNPHHQEFSRLCKEVLGFSIGIMPTERNQDIGIYISNTETISIADMGDGVASILGLMLSLLTENNKLYLIEEIENDLHPKALKKLLNLIIEKSLNNQFVISTHSNIVLKHLGGQTSSKIFYIEPKLMANELNIPTSTVKAIKASPEARIEVLQKLGYDFMDYELHEAYLILEESSAEQIIRDFLIPHLVPELIGRIRTIAAQGVTDLEVRAVDFSRLFVYIHTSEIYKNKAWIVADGDQVGKDVIEKLKNQFKGWKPEHFINWKQECFEYYYPEKFQEQVRVAFEIKDKAKRKEAKAKLLKEVVSWSRENIKEAKTEFSKSAKEIIDVLKEIHKSINIK